MSSPMRADVASLTTEAGTFDRISGDLEATRLQVEAIAAQAQANLNSTSAGIALQAALQRYREASHQQNVLLSQISENIHVTGAQYDATDANNASAVQTAMGSVL